MAAQQCFATAGGGRCRGRVPWGLYDGSASRAAARRRGEVRENADTLAAGPHGARTASIDAAAGGCPACSCPGLLAWHWLGSHHFFVATLGVSRSPKCEWRTPFARRTMSTTFPVRVKESAARGRDLVATRRIDAGDVVLTVAPFGIVPHDAFMLTVCCGCLQPCPLQRRCQGCAAVLLCADCATAGHRNALLHADECASLRQLRDDPAVRPARDGGGPDRSEASSAVNVADSSGLRLLLRLIYARNRERSGLLPALQLRNDAQDVIEDDTEAFESLEDNSHLFPTELNEAISEAAATAKYLVDPAARASTADYSGILARMFCNAFTLQQYRDPLRRTRQPKQEVGSGVFATAALINHSCRPNAEVRLSEDGFLDVVALRAVADGDTLSVSYLPLPLPGGGIEARRKELKAAFFFDCDCGCGSGIGD